MPGAPVDVTAGEEGLIAPENESTEACPVNKGGCTGHACSKKHDNHKGEFPASPDEKDLKPDPIPAMVDNCAANIGDPHPIFAKGNDWNSTITCSNMGEGSYSDPTHIPKLDDHTP